jgi:multicomponent Na+:H+ antiporter subunit E
MSRLPAAPPPSRTGTGLRAVALRFALLLAAWVVLSGPDTKGWLLALLLVGAVTALSFRMVPAGGGSPRLLPLLRFAPFFLGHSLRGGVDVAMRALRPGARVEPRLLSLRLRLPTTPSRAFLAAVTGLFPGTAATRLSGSWLTVHVLDRSIDAEPQIRLLETRVAALFEVSLVDDPPGS